jgi:hypothetical protein
MAPFTHVTLSRQSVSTMSLPTSKKRNLITALLCLRARLETPRTRIVEDWIRAYESALRFCVVLGTTVRNAYIYRLDLSAEKVTYLGQHENAVSAMNYAREQSGFPFDFFPPSFRQHET